MRTAACGNHAPHQPTKHRKFSLFFIPLFSVGTKYLDRLYRLWANHRGQQAAGRDSGPAGRQPGPAVIRPRLSLQRKAG
jgi:hypothetical protein